MTAREFLFTHALYREDPQGYYKVPFARAPYLQSSVYAHGYILSAKESSLATGYTVYAHGYILSAKESSLATGYTVYAWEEPGSSYGSLFTV